MPTLGSSVERQGCSDARAPWCPIRGRVLLAALGVGALHDLCGPAARGAEPSERTGVRMLVLRYEQPQPDDLVHLGVQRLARIDPLPSAQRRCGAGARGSLGPLLAQARGSSACSLTTAAATARWMSQRRASDWAAGTGGPAVHAADQRPGRASPRSRSVSRRVSSLSSLANTTFPQGRIDPVLVAEVQEQPASLDAEPRLADPRA